MLSDATRSGVRVFLEQFVGQYLRIGHDLVDGAHDAERHASGGEGDLRLGDRRGR